MKKCAWFALILVLAWHPAVLGQALEVPNAGFEAGADDAIAHWTLMHGKGGATIENPGEGARSARLCGDPDSTSYWKSEPLPLAPRGVYALHYLAKRVGRGGGPFVAGTAFTNDVLYAFEPEVWEPHTVIFQTPDNITPDRSWLRFGQARMSPESTVLFDAVRVVPVQPVYAGRNGVELGAGETLLGNRYESTPLYGTRRINQYRSLFGYRNTVFNHNAFLMGDGSEIVMRHQLDGRRQLSAELSLCPLYQSSGTLVVEACTDGVSWQPLGRFVEKAGQTFKLPGDFFPANEVWVRMRCEAEAPAGDDFALGALGISAYAYRAEVDGEPTTLRGETRFVEVLEADPDIDARVAEVGDIVPGGHNVFVVECRHSRATELAATAKIEVTRGGQIVSATRTPVRLAPATTNQISLPYSIEDYGDYSLTLSLEEGPAFTARITEYVSPLYATNYGRRLPSQDATGVLWWASSGWKISQNAQPPDAETEAITIRVARNEAEAAQLVVRPARELSNFRATVGELRGPGGVVMPKDAVALRKVEYVDVTAESDRLGAAAPWPDPLPPLAALHTLPRDRNQPIWIRVTVPKTIPAGIYRGKLRLSATRYGETVPLEVEVFDFTLPDAATLEASFGLSHDVINEYHRLEREEDRRAVWEMYLREMAAHRMSPYNPAPYDTLQVTWPSKATRPEDMRAEIDASKWAAEMERVLAAYRFGTFRFPIPGLMGSKYPKHRREIEGFKADTPEFHALFNSYAKQVEGLLREKEWLDKACVYWFDEPSDLDIDFVRSGMDLLRNAAPGLRRMIALNNADHQAALAGCINTWCPQINVMNPEFVHERQALGERAWWYVCTNPKTPYPGVFIDHPAVDLRVWSWMAWGHGIQGCLIWSTNRWHSRSAYPDALQNPYLDPMTWQGDAGAGLRAPYGNGDGVLFLPPKAAFESKDGPVLEEPVPTQRVELLRDGIEDYEYFALLRKLLEQKEESLSKEARLEYKALLTPPTAVYTSRQNYSFDPAPMETHRDKLARAISAVAALP